MIKDKEVSKQKVLLEQLPSAKNIDSQFGTISNLSIDSNNRSYIINNVFILTNSVILQRLETDTVWSRLFCNIVEHYSPRDNAALHTKDNMIHSYYLARRRKKATNACPNYNPALCRDKKAISDVIPIIVATDRRSIEFVRKNASKLGFCVIRACDFLKSDGKSFSSLYYKVRDAGGAAAYFGINVPIILSFIMIDDLCFRITEYIASELIRGLKVSVATTFDTATYTNQRDKADLRMEQIRVSNRLLIDRNPDIFFIGIVKGSYVKQIEDHITELKSLGITEFIFHAGDFLNRGSWSEKKTLRQFVGVIRQNVPFLYIYGIGSRSSFELVPHADGIITLSHIIETKNGKFTDADGNTHQSGRFEKNSTDVQTSLFGDIVSDERDMLHEAELTFSRIVHDFSTVRLKYEEIYQADLSSCNTLVSISLEDATSCLKCHGCPAGWC